MKYDIKNLPQSLIEITVELPFEEIQPQLIKAAQKLSTDAKIEGFRPGKAPYDIVKNKFGEMAILQEATDNIIAGSFFRIIKEKNLTTIGQPKIDLEKIAPGNPFNYKATVALLPQVKVGDYSGLQLKRRPIEIKPEATDQVITEIRKMRSSEKIVERAAQAGDRVEIDFDIYLDKVPIENGQHKKYPLVLGEEKFIPGFEERISGLKAGDSKEFNLKFPEKYFEPKLAGKLADFKVSCLAVSEISLPTADDEFAQQVSGGNIATLSDLRANIAKNLELEETNKQEQRLEIEMLEKIVGLSEFDPLPDLLVHEEIHRMLHELEDSVSRQGFNFPDYLQAIKKTEADLEKELRPQAEMRVKTAILSREIYGRQNLEVRPDEIEAEIELILKNYPENPDMRRQLESETYKDYLKNVLGNRKVIEYLKGQIIK